MYEVKWKGWGSRFNTYHKEDDLDGCTVLLEKYKASLKNSHAVRRPRITTIDDDDKYKLIDMLLGKWCMGATRGR